MEDEYLDYASEEEIKLMAKQAKCRHNYRFIMMKCEKCGSVKSEKTLPLGLINDIIKESGSG